jgi:hypothetical protein
VPGWEQSSAAFWLLRSAYWNPPDLHQLVGQPPPQLGIADDLLQLLVQKDGVRLQSISAWICGKKKAKKSAR